MQAIILLAGYGSRLDRPDLAHKALLPFEGETLLSRHLSALADLGVEKAHLVLGHNADRVRQYVESLNTLLPVSFRDNKRYRTTGNTLSMALGLRGVEGDALVMDGDVLYPRQALVDYVRSSRDTSFAVVPVDIDNEEASKVILKPGGCIQAFVTKRLLTLEEKNRYEFAGEAIGFFKLNRAAVDAFLSLYEENEKEYETSLWEVPLTDLAQSLNIFPWKVKTGGCFEIDTPEDYQQALDYFSVHGSLYE